MTFDLDAARRAARRFFWSWLILASVFSMSANVAHAVLVAPRDMLWWAGLLAIVAPSVQIAATHAISHLVRARAQGWVYWLAFAGTILLAVGAFMVSFDAITALSRNLGFTGRIAGLPVAAIFPLVIDVSISIATLCLLAQSLAAATVCDEPEAGPAAGAVPRVADEAAAEAHRVAPAFAAMHDVQPAARAQAPRDDPLPLASARVDEHTDTTACASPGPVSHAVSELTPDAVVPGGIASGEGDALTDPHLALAETLVRNKLTRKDPRLVAGLLADGAAGLSCQAISDKHKVHHSVVRKVLQAAELAAS